MNLRLTPNQRTLLAVFITLMIAFEMIAYVSTVPRPTEAFFQLYVLGANHMAGAYYPNNDNNIKVGEVVTWYLGTTNNMGMVQLISIRVKAGNQSIAAPNDSSAVESPAPVVTDFERALLDNETWEVPFVWSISNATSTGGSTRVLMLNINNETYPISDWDAKDGYNFRLVFELWTWQTDANAFEFGWTANNEHKIAWLQLWFNMTTAGPTLPQA